jgi:hypothetical protein
LLLERYGIRVIIKKRENKPAKTTKTNFQSNGDIEHTKNFQNWGLQLHSEQYYIKSVDLIGAFGINQFTENGKIKNQKERKTKNERNRQKLQEQFFKNNMII